MEKDSSDSLVSSGEESNEHSDVDAVHYSDKTLSDNEGLQILFWWLEISIFK